MCVCACVCVGGGGGGGVNAMEFKQIKLCFSS